MASPVPSQDPAIQTGVSDAVTGGKTVVSDVEQKNIPGALGAASSLYSQLSPIVPTIVQEAKAGYKTTEFWLLLAYEGLQQGEVLFPTHGVWAQIAAKVSPVIAYILSRGIAKLGVGNQTKV